MKTTVHLNVQKKLTIELTIFSRIRINIGFFARFTRFKSHFLHTQGESIKIMDSPIFIVFMRFFVVPNMKCKLPNLRRIVPYLA